MNKRNRKTHRYRGKPDGCPAGGGGAGCNGGRDEEARMGSYEEVTRRGVQHGEYGPRYRKAACGARWGRSRGRLMHYAAVWPPRCTPEALTILYVNRN